MLACCLAVILPRILAKPVDVLVAEKSAKAGQLTLTVHHVWVTDQYTKVELSATNSGRVSLSLPLYGNCQLIVPGGRTLSANAFAGDWPETVPPGVPVRGTIEFDPLPPGTTKISVSFGQVFGPGPHSVTIRDIVLKPHPMATSASGSGGAGPLGNFGSGILRLNHSQSGFAQMQMRSRKAPAIAAAT